MLSSGFTHERGHEGQTNIWLTPKWLTDALGAFDLDPCAAPEPRPWDIASTHYDITRGQDGLLLPWNGRVFCNPPYGPHTGTWMRRCAAHAKNGGSSIGLIFARTETEDWQDVVIPQSSGILFLRGRVRFCDRNGNEPRNAKGQKNSPGAPSALVAFGDAEAELLKQCSLRGQFMQWKMRCTPGLLEVQCG